MQGPLDFFFKLGEKVTKGDPARQADFVYYMVWILFTAFLWLFFFNAYDLFWNGNLNAATWTLVGFAISGIQYFSLKGMYDMKQMRKQASIPAKESPLESVDEMMKEFGDDKEVKKEVKKNVRKTKSK